MNTPVRFSSRVARLHGSALRTIFNAIDSGNIISFAGGLPAPDSFPDFEEGFLEQIPDVMQYGTSAGEWPLRQRIASKITQSGLAVSPEQILILSGSQQGIDLVAKLFIDFGTEVAVESPTYLAALQVFTFFGARYRSFRPGCSSDLELLGKPSLLYTNPTFQNPSSAVYSHEERLALAEYCDSNATVLFEDDPDRELVYESCETTPVCAHIESSSWIYQSSFSKSLCPGLRLGFLASSEDLVEPLLHLKQAADLHSSRISQALVMQALQSTDADDRLTHNIALYRELRDHFNECLVAEFGGIADWSVPAGGLFFWLQLKPGIVVDMANLLKASLLSLIHI